MICSLFGSSNRSRAIVRLSVLLQWRAIRGWWSSVRSGSVETNLWWHYFGYRYCIKYFHEGSSKKEEIPRSWSSFAWRRLRFRYRFLIYLRGRICPFSCLSVFLRPKSSLDVFHSLGNSQKNSWWRDRTCLSRTWMIFGSRTTGKKLWTYVPGTDRQTCLRFERRSQFTILIN